MPKPTSPLLFLLATTLRAVAFTYIAGRAPDTRSVTDPLPFVSSAATRLVFASLKAALGVSVRGSRLPNCKSRRTHRRARREEKCLTLLDLDGKAAIIVLFPSHPMLSALRSGCRASDRGRWRGRAMKARRACRGARAVSCYTSVCVGVACIATQPCFASVLVRYVALRLRGTDRHA